MRLWGEVPAEPTVRHEYNPALQQYLDITLNNISGQPVRRHGSGQHASRPVLRFKDCNPVAEKIQIMCTGEASRASADDGHRFRTCFGVYQIGRRRHWADRCTAVPQLTRRFNVVQPRLFYDDVSCLGRIVKNIKGPMAEPALFVDCLDP